MQKIAVYPGSFDPPTLGHLDIIERASRQCDQLIVALGANNSKTPFFTTQDRFESLVACTQHLSNVQVETFKGLLVHYAQNKNASMIIRGLRAVSDFDFEFQVAMANRKLDSKLETVFFMTSWETSYLTSSVVREVARLGGNYREFVPVEVATMMDRALKT